MTVHGFNESKFSMTILLENFVLFPFHYSLFILRQLARRYAGAAGSGAGHGVSGKVIQPAERDSFVFERRLAQ